MCGIWGYSFSDSMAPSQDSFTMRAVWASHLMLTMDDRGGDSWGFIMRQDNKLAVKRGIGLSFEKVDPQLLAGLHQVVAHTRKASVGSTCIANAHPFEHEHILGVHNGSVFNWREMNVKYQRSCAVDSEHIIMHLAEGKDLGELQASGTVCYVDKNDPYTVNLAHSAYGDLELFGIGTDKPTEICWGTIWASEDKILEPLLKASGFPYIHYTTKPKTLYQVKNGDSRMMGELAMTGYGGTVTVVHPTDTRDSSGTHLPRRCFRCCQPKPMAQMEYDYQLKEWFCFTCQSGYAYD